MTSHDGRENSLRPVYRAARRLPTRRLRHCYRCSNRVPYLRLRYGVDVLSLLRLTKPGGDVILLRNIVLCRDKWIRNPQNIKNISGYVQ